MNQGLVNFEALYIAVRNKENRVYSDQEVRQLPNLPVGHPQYEEWQLRVETMQRFSDYLSQQSFKNALDIGCGNGWFSNQIYKHNIQVEGLDINKHELRQAARLFPHNSFQYGDIFNHKYDKSFDLITLNASVQYFKDIEKLTEQLRTFLSPKGEIHILDSPFYETNKNQLEAKERTKSYYNSQGFDGLSAYYHHHTIQDIKSLGYEALFTPKKSLFNRVNPFSKSKSPFYWLKWSE